ncbi:MAG TPA: aminotransferase class V-fold PLP-dependent enzyme [Thermoanaerobaculia bacterium]|nr:aminotransferase class V-fold PLP-dependent enzyme [Thermoanaerobaculia bacterium]
MEPTADHPITRSPDHPIPFDPLLRFRPEFPILARSTYLISNSLGAMPRGAASALAEYAETWATRGVRAWADSWWEMSVSIGDEIAPLLDAPSGSVSMLPNVTIASAVLLSSLRYEPPRNRIVLADGEFPSLRYVYDSLATRLGAEVVTVPSPGGDGLAADEQRIADAIDERTILVAVSHVLFKSAFVVDVAAIAEKCRRVGALLAVDAYQSVGTLPVSVGALGCDALVGGVLKWLCGGPGGAFLYVRPDLRARLSPALTGWMAHPSPFDFEPPPVRLREDAFRFLLGTPAIPALYAAREGPRLVRAAGAQSIREKSLRQTGRLLELSDARGLRSATPRDPARRGGTAAVDFENALEVSRELNARDVVVDYRPGVGIRLSPHFYTEDAELDRAFAAIDEIRESGAWRRWREHPALVT